MSRDPERAATQFFGGRVCLDFANTLDWRTSAEPQELISDYGAFLTWSERRGTLHAAATTRLRATAATHPAAAIAVLREAHAFRDEIWQAADALRARDSVDLIAINLRLASLPAQPAVIRLPSGRFVYDLNGDRLAQPLWPVLWSLTALLTSDDAARIGCCQAEGCGWIFVDESPNRSRLWCSSEVCGNRERVRRAYAKRRQSSDRSGASDTGGSNSGQI